MCQLWALHVVIKLQFFKHLSLQKGYISPIWAEAPTRAIYVKNCVAGDILDVITCAKFQNEIFRGYHFTGGRIFHFPIDM